MSAEPVAAALAAYRRPQHGLQVARTRRGTNPWLGCPLSLSQLHDLLERLTPAELETVHAALCVLLHHLERMSASSPSAAPAALAV